MTFKVFKHNNSIGANKPFTKSNFNLSMWERLKSLISTLQNVTLMNKNSEIYRPAGTKLRSVRLPKHS